MEYCFTIGNFPSAYCYCFWIRFCFVFNFDHVWSDRCSLRAHFLQYKKNYVAEYSRHGIYFPLEICSLMPILEGTNQKLFFSEMKIGLEILDLKSKSKFQQWKKALLICLRIPVSNMKRQGMTITEGNQTENQLRDIIVGRYRTLKYCTTRSQLKLTTSRHTTDKDPKLPNDKLIVSCKLNESNVESFWSCAITDQSEQSRFVVSQREAGTCLRLRALVTDWHK